MDSRVASPSSHTVSWALMIAVLRLSTASIGVLLLAETIGRTTRDDFVEFPGISSSIWLLVALSGWTICCIAGCEAFRAPRRVVRWLHDASVIITASIVGVLIHSNAGSILLVMLISTVVLAVGTTAKPAPVLLGMVIMQAVTLISLRTGLLEATKAVVAIGLCSVGSLWVGRQLRAWEGDRHGFAQTRKTAAGLVGVNVRLQDAVDRTASATRIRERTRIARDIHDDLGHTLTAVIVQLQAAREVLRVQPHLLADRLARLEEMVSATIQDVRRTVSGLRDDSRFDRIGTKRWQRLCTAFADATGMAVTTTMSDDLETVSPLVSETVYRIIQEALTNAYRHGNAEMVDVSMEHDRQRNQILLRVSDDGDGADVFDVGNGLAGVRERVISMQGEIIWQTSPGRGFDIGVVIPWRLEETA